MIYENIRNAVFIERPNRFTANIEINGSPHVCHVKNTGRCRELLIPGASILVQEFDSASRKTAYDLISVWKDGRLINMDSAAPNKVFGEWAASGNFKDGITLIRPEFRHGDSRFDFYIECGDTRVFAEVKGVTLEDCGVVRFPDAPTERGLKHINGLIECARQGFEAWAVFIVQMRDVKYFEPNRATHPEFADALCRAADSGVNLLALDCDVTETSISVRSPVEIRL